MVKLTKIYTRGGDNGVTSLGNGKRVPKYSERPTAYGSVDEANASIGLARLEASESQDKVLARIQNDLFDVGADLCTPEDATRKTGPLRVSQVQVDRLEAEIDKMNEQLQPLSSFVLPGGSRLAAYLHNSRVIVRRAERDITLLASKENINPLVAKYINRLSDHLFVFSRHVNDDGELDVLWEPGKNIV
ncbi:MAG: ATP:cob(I)alamin adenosyltransferase [Rhodospirillaceae bacterium]|nr:ATP:cob(I)alamin adenosyltransferase [Rhodospirillaceae bacterium]|tara:strand:+ start:942 stop:1508 length:567 start_codon:yes stop_codon:yes gene_type:complete